MHRQSLGSPSSQLHLHGSPKEAPFSPQEPRRRLEVDDDNNKAHRLSLSSSPAPNKLIHLIPVLTLLCFFILYLFSHSPSQSDLAQFNGFKRSSSHFDSAAEMNDIQKYMNVERGDVLAIRSLRNLREIGKPSEKSRPHRKFADF
ncbi:hypothetical protein QN277_004467 [Acacia crassicarpa]|uniref:Uncharacterized protein n=1 Tax=Acacia crassicarpa TaxID=499986 RepID=A0AAE1MIF0_9FABA|nr:hypothetical protein QN277_004467 [Acacia crassicarpa]